jgi:hypothetical protein
MHVTLPVLLASAPGGARRGDPGGTMTDSTRQQWWNDYKAGWELAGTFKEEGEAAIQSWLMQAPTRWSTRDAQIDDDLLRDLELLVQVRAANRRMVLNPGRGDRVGPDYATELRGSTEDLERSLRVIERLRELGWKDPWIETGLARYAAFLMEVVEARADRLEMDQGRATPQVLGARALLAHAGSSLRRPSR